MFQLINNILHEFRKNFKRIKTWKWIVVLILGFIVRSKHQGITSIISSLRLKPRLYHTMLHFFRSRAYTVESLYDKWVKTAVKQAELIRIRGRLLVLGDHTKASKEGLRMPGIQILHQDSQNSGKAKYISGHNYGQVSALITNGKVSRSLPLMTEFQESLPKTDKFGVSLVVAMVNLVAKTAKSAGEPVIAALDAYFSTGTAWEAIEKTITNITVVNGEKLLWTPPVTT